MPTRLTINGKPTVTRNWQAHPPIPRYEDKRGNPVDVVTPIPVESVESTFRHGVPYPASDGVTYNVVQYLDPRQGWGTAEHWLKRYPVSHATLLKWVHLGILDAAMESGSPTKRYRVRDEARVTLYLRENPAAKLQGRRMPDNLPGRRVR